MKYLLSPDGMHAILLDRIVGFDLIYIGPHFKISVRYKDQNGTQPLNFVDKIADLEEGKTTLEYLINRLNKIEPEGRSLDNTRKVEL